MSVSAAVAGSLAGGLISSAGQYMANQQLIENQNKWNDISVHLADTAHQREIKDLEAAGINPILTASSSGSAVPSLGTAQIGNVGEGIASGMNSAARVMNPLVQSQIDVNSAQAQNLLADGELKKAQAKIVKSGSSYLPDKVPAPSEIWSSAKDVYDGVRTWISDKFLPGNPVKPSLHPDNRMSPVPVEYKVKATPRAVHEGAVNRKFDQPKKRRHN